MPQLLRLQATPSIPIPPPGDTTPVFMKNMSYTYWWYYQPSLPVYLP